MATRSEKWFDVTFVLKKFNANEMLTFEDIASEFGMSGEELEKRLTTLAGSDEKGPGQKGKKAQQKEKSPKGKGV